ncbi:MAG: M16 family metallopeptidase, partial [Bacteroidia bacterium]
FTGSSLVYCSGLSRHKSELFDLLTDVTLNPTFPQEELDKIKTKTISGLKADKEDPSSISRNLVGAVVYGKDHPYGEIMTEATVAAITADDCKQYYDAFFTPQAAYLVIVGDITLKEAKKMANSGFGKWQGHKLVKGRLNTPPQPSSNKVAFAHRTGAVQSVVSVTYPIERKPGAPDAVASNIMNQILGGSSFGARLMQNLREDKAYTYGCRSSIGSDEYVARFSAGASVRNEVTDSAIAEILKEMKMMVDELVTEDELQRVKSSLKGSFSRGLENPQTIASYALNTSLYNLPKDYYNTYLQRVEAVTVADVKKAAKKYMKPENCYIVVVGDGVNVAPKLEKFGEVSFYDAFADKTSAPGFALPDGTTAASILNKALKSYGGADKVNGIKTYAVYMEAVTPQGNVQVEKIVSLKKQMYLQAMIAGGQAINEVKLYKGKFSQTQMGAVVEMNEAGQQRVLDNMPLYDEVKILEDVKNAKVVGGEFLNGEKVAVIEYTNNDVIQKRYYSIETGYLLSTSSIVDDKETAWNYSEYTNYNGFMYPKKATSNVMPFPLEVTKLEVNSKIDKKLFK